ncbi:MAG: transporter ATP-binding protein, partial [Acidimicrobiales bacterium]|nr:transporter ATP-binding protein [Acidimicrobiales bacterium]
MAAQFIYSMHKVGRFYPPDRDVLKDISLSFYPGAKIGVLGGNGAGKSSLLRVMAGKDDGFTGEARLTPGFTVGMLDQEPQLDAAKDVKGNVMDGVAEVAGLLEAYDACLAKYADPDADYEKIGEEQARLEAEIAAKGANDLERHIEIAMDALRLPPGDAEVGPLSGGERRRVALCRLLLAKPDLLLLDEPTNHLDAESVAWLERFLRDYHGTVVAITHDRYFLDNVAGWILELDRGRGMPFEGNYSGWLEQKSARLAQEEKADSGRQRTLERELEWVRMAPKARQAKGKARLAAYEKLLAEAKESEGRSDGLEIFIPSGERLGDQVVELDHVSKGYGDKLLIEDLSFSLPRAGIIGVIGPNGAGKTTLFRMLTGQEEPDGGTVTVGKTVQFAYVDQSRDSLDDDKTVYEEITGGRDDLVVGGREIHGRAYVASFNFKGSDQQKKVGVLSGGERNRVHLAKLLKEGGNVLLLDEPTNDLDVDTLR